MKLTKPQINNIEQALEPYEQHIKQRGIDPSMFVRELCGWYVALRNNPDRNIPALMQELGYDKSRLVETLYPGVFQRYAQMENYIRRMNGHE